MENIDDEDMVLYYQVDYILTRCRMMQLIFMHSSDRINPLPYKTDYAIVDNIKGKGQYVGTYMA